MVFRGGVYRVPGCRLSGWYAIDRVGEVWRCNGCHEDSPIPSIPKVPNGTTTSRTLRTTTTRHADPLADPVPHIQGLGHPTQRQSLGFYPGCSSKRRRGVRAFP